MGALCRQLNGSITNNITTRPLYYKRPLNRLHSIVYTIPLANLKCFQSFCFPLRAANWGRRAGLGVDARAAGPARQRDPCVRGRLCAAARVRAGRRHGRVAAGDGPRALQSRSTSCNLSYKRHKRAEQSGGC